MTPSILGLDLRPVRHKDTLQKRHMPSVRAISLDDQSGILDSREYPGGEPRFDALLAGEFDHSKIMSDMLQLIDTSAR
jgi:hypothetical protein